MKYAMALDYQNCINCKACETACKEENGVQLGAKKQRIWVGMVEGAIFCRPFINLYPSQCNHCEDAPCVSVCPTHASHIVAGGIVKVDAEKCILCKGCMEACPYDARFVDDFTNKISNEDAKLTNSLNDITDLISMILRENKSNGLTLDESSDILLENVDKLNMSSNEAAASLEETAAALEEVTSNIRNNTGNILKMANHSNNVRKSANEGEKLAKETTDAMEEMNMQVNSINDSISVIDQIAFQTNILSLNAAEVRSLANRSAEAAKEIKTIVENATIKANDGKEIANNMIIGYKELNQGITQTVDLIEDIEMSSKEQLLGVEQINMAINELDQQTQKNAEVSAQTHNVAVDTDMIAKLIVKNADEKEFIGKNEVKAKDLT